jgi:hypothetical protein
MVPFPFLSIISMIQSFFYFIIFKFKLILYRVSPIDLVDEIKGLSQER